jgi:hypothetical protein
MQLPKFNSKQQIPAWKVALIPGLVVVLVIVLLPKSEEEPLSVAVAQASSPSEPKKLNRSALPPLPTVELAEALEYDPFQLPESLQALVQLPADIADADQDAADAQIRERELAAHQTRMEGLRQLKVSLVLRTSQGTAAVVNSQVVRVGDELQPGIRVVKIENDSVTVRLERVAEAATKHPLDR